ncbi:hypothetical protein HYDPIDRAFT_40581 [Hydnomerulius pinastri MD-312]|uniref:Uncharacterized protein n=1 Tax=Hydnomerulius pinastri MD-312 TaxID=994086 RepID=A0A0C9W0Q5_9AGAM|nr:hypothetical protein HYDPIDRAFT_40581 [Hydnomerulius pinastri MD-312]
MDSFITISEFPELPQTLSSPSRSDVEDLVLVDEDTKGGYPGFCVVALVNATSIISHFHHFGVTRLHHTLIR